MKIHGPQKPAKLPARNIGILKKLRRLEAQLNRLERRFRDLKSRKLKG